MRPAPWATLLASVLGCATSDVGKATTSAPVVDAGGATIDGGAMVPTEAADARLASFATRFLDEYLERNPTRATELGDHRYDGRWPDLSAEGEAIERRFVEARLKELQGIGDSELSVQARIDRGLLENQLRYWLFAIDELKGAETDPMLVTRLVGDGLDPLVTRSFGSIEQRMASLLSRLSGIPGIVAVAKKRLGRPPRIYTETAMQQNQGLITLCKHDLAEQGLFTKAPAQKAALTAAAATAAAALEDYQAFLEKELLPRSDGDFRLGRARFEKKLRLELDDPVDIDAVASGARSLLMRTLDDMADTARELWPEVMKPAPLPALGSAAERKALVRKVLDKLAEDHPDNARILKDASDWLVRATAFVREHDLVRMPTEPCKVIEMPEYRRGVAIAYCDSSGPLEKDRETFYAISPTPKDWPKKRVDSFYREYNKSMLGDLTVHEAMPGHYLQLMHNNDAAGNRSATAEDALGKLRSVFSSGAFVEGWAVYSEWLMAKYGFGGPRVRMMRQKMVLRLSVNAILDHDVHAGAMDEKEALDLMMNDAFQEEGEAVAKWKRARLSSAQLTTYYYGFTEMMKLRAAHENAPGFSERAYHDRLIGFGSPSMRALRALLTR
jgi:uncharacterized protein (DUF885 family)